MEYAKYGCLRSNLRKMASNSDGQLNDVEDCNKIKLVLTFAAQISKGMVYLEGLKVLSHEQKVHF